MSRTKPAIGVAPIGTVHNRRPDPQDPDHWGDGESTIVVAPCFGDHCLTGLDDFSHVEVVLHMAASSNARTTGSRCAPRPGRPARLKGGSSRVARRSAGTCRGDGVSPGVRCQARRNAAAVISRPVRARRRRPEPSSGAAQFVDRPPISSTRVNGDRVVSGSTSIQPCRFGCPVITAASWRTSRRDFREAGVHLP